MIGPYKQWPKPVRVALLTLGDGGQPLLLDEKLRTRTLAELQAEPRWRIYTSPVTVRDLLHRDVGELLTWNGEQSRYRLQRVEGPGWKPQEHDIRVLNLPFPEDALQALRALRRWRDWLWRYGAVPGSIGQASWSLLRATLERPFWTNMGEPPPISFTVGGRIQMLAAQGEYQGKLAHLDLPAAYGSTLGELLYGGRWRHLKPTEAAHWGNVGLPLFLRARVRVPEGAPCGPLIRRPRKRPTLLQGLFFPAEYPRGVTLQGVWTHEELMVARAYGCHVAELEAWLHMPARRADGMGYEQPFLPWWQAIQEGRRMQGFAGKLAKACGNALWGQFAIEPGKRVVVTLEGRGERRRRLVRDASFSEHAGRPPAHDLTETVCGRVRAQLTQMMLATGGALLCVHTDGGWLDERAFPELDALEGWRVKERARKLRLLNPSRLAYDDGKQMRYVTSGWTREQAEEHFESHWQAFEWERDRQQAFAERRRRSH